MNPEVTLICKHCKVMWKKTMLFKNNQYNSIHIDVVHTCGYNSIVFAEKIMPSKKDIGF